MGLRKGQKVAYPNQGACVIESIEQKRIGENIVQFYSLRVLNDNSTILVPKNNAESVGIRPLITSGECKKLIKALSADFEDISADWKTRSRAFMTQLQSGDVFEAADVLKKLTFLAHEKKLSFREQNLLEKARFLVVSEVSVAEPTDAETLKDQLESLIQAACRKHLRSQPAL